MWHWIVEHPLKLLIYTAILCAVLGYAGYVLPNRRGLWKLAGGLMGLGLVLAIIGWFTETDVDAVRKVVYAAAKAVEENDIEQAVSYISDSLPQEKSRARNELQRYRFFRVVVKSNLAIDVDADHDPPRAAARFNVVAVLASRDGALDKMNIPRFVILRFRKEGDEWKITGFEHDEPLPHMRQH